MSTTTQPKILILTAGFGDGHNSAALNLAKALEGKASIRLEDPLALGNPSLNKRLRQAYRMMINHTPTLWSTIYYGTDKFDFSKPSRLLPKNPEITFHKSLKSFQPDTIVSTYPLYPYFAERAFESLPRVPVFTIVTDSIRINKAWTAAPTDYFLVTDSHTKKLITSETIPEDKIQACGFPVNPSFEHLPKIAADDPCEPFKILYFPTNQKPQIRRIMRALLQAAPDKKIQLTVVLGRNFRKLYSRAQEIKKEFPNQVTIKGWTKKVPELVSSHHLVVGKAGGATTHECLAATTPMLIHYLLPGQEEGNLELLEKIGGGALADSHEKLHTAVRSLLANDAQQWREMKQALCNLNQPNGASATADFILNKLADQ